MEGWGRGLLIGAIPAFSRSYCGKSWKASEAISTCLFQGCTNIRRQVTMAT